MTSLLTACINIADDVSAITTSYNTTLGTDSAFDDLHTVIVEGLLTLQWEADMINDMAVDLANAWAGMDCGIDCWEVQTRLHAEMKEYWI